MSPHAYPSASFMLEGIDFCYDFKEASRYKFKVEKIFLTRIIFQENLMLKLKLISRVFILKISVRGTRFSCLSSASAYKR